MVDYGAKGEKKFSPFFYFITLPIRKKQTTKKSERLLFRLSIV